MVLIISGHPGGLTDPANQGARGAPGRVGYPGQNFRNFSGQNFRNPHTAQAAYRNDIVRRLRRPAAHGGELAAVFDFIEVFYNRTCRHSSLGFVSPNAFEAAYYRDQAA